MSCIQWTVNERPPYKMITEDQIIIQLLPIALVSTNYCKGGATSAMKKTGKVVSPGLAEAFKLKHMYYANPIGETIY